MEIKIYGFTFDKSKLAKALPAPKIYPLLEAEKPIKWKHFQVACKRMPFEAHRKSGIYTDEWWAGIVLKIRDAQNFTYLTEEKGKTVLTAEELAPGRKLAEVGFFLAHPQTGRGLLSHYHQSCSIINLGQIIHKIYADQCRKRIQEIADSKEGTIKYRRSLARFHRGAAYIDQMLVAGKLSDLVRQLRTVNNVRVGVQSIELKESRFKFLQTKSHRETITFFLPGDANAASVADWIDEVEMADDEELTVRGKTGLGKAEVFHRERNPLVFGRLDYDAMTKDLRLDLNDWEGSIRNSVLIRELHRTAMRPHIRALLEPLVAK
jgi:hypothetical protein